MKKKFSYLLILLIGLLGACKDPNAGFSPGAGDGRLAGTWQLYERRFPKDSSYTILVKRDSLAIAKDTTKPRPDTVLFIRRDTSFYTTKRYPAASPQTLTFAADGSLSGSGTEMTYYAPIKNYLVDKTYPDSLSVNFYISTNRAQVTFQQGLELRKDTLFLKPRCDQPCYSKLLRVR